MAPDVSAAQLPAPPKLIQKRVHHLLHAILSVCTGGMWLFVWAPLAVAVGRENRKRRRDHSKATSLYAAQMAIYHETESRRWSGLPGTRVG